MNCPDCDHDNTSIRDTRNIENGDAVRRRRECNRCQFRFTTYERKEWESVRVKKRDGSIEPYDREKVRSGIQVAVEKRPVTTQTVTELVEAITAEIKGRDEQIVGSHVIGDAVAERLRELDKVAYVRFVSVFNGYTDPEDFKEVLDRLLADANGDTATAPPDQSQQQSTPSE